MCVQALWDRDSVLLQLPHITKEIAAKCAAAKTLALALTLTLSLPRYFEALALTLTLTFSLPRYFEQKLAAKDDKKKSA